MQTEDPRGRNVDDEAAPVDSTGDDDFDNLMKRRIHRTRSGRRTRLAIERLHVRQCDNPGPGCGAQLRTDASAGGSAPAHVEVAQLGMQGGGDKVGKRQRSGNWTDATLQKAMDVVTDHGMKVKAAARAFDIPASSLRDHLYGKTTSRQRDNLPTLKPDEEKKLVDCIFKMQDLGHPLSPAVCRATFKSCLSHSN